MQTQSAMRLQLLQMPLVCGIYENQIFQTMRKIRFRAKTIETNKWVYGSLLINYYDRLCNSIVSADIQGTDIYNIGERCWKSVLVNYDTIGQSTGLCDKDGKEIYEGDIIQSRNFTSSRSEVIWLPKRAAFGFRIYWKDNPDDYILGDWLTFDGTIRVIGNIHDNPELIKKLD